VAELLVVLPKLLHFLLTPELNYEIFVSHNRAGILYINPGDLGWNPYVTSWIETREQQAEKANLTVLFDKYIPSLQVNFCQHFVLN